MAGRQLLDDPRLLCGRHHAELRLLWDGPILRGDHKRQASPELLLRPGRMGLRRCEGQSRMRLEICSQRLGQSRIDIGGEIVNWVVSYIEIRGGLFMGQQVDLDRPPHMIAIEGVLLLDLAKSKGVDFRPGDRHS